MSFRVYKETAGISENISDLTQSIESLEDLTRLFELEQKQWSLYSSIEMNTEFDTDFAMEQLVLSDGKKVYSWDGLEWKETSNISGDKFRISGDGKRIAGIDTDKIKVYYDNISSWTQVGGDIGFTGVSKVLINEDGGLVVGKGDTTVKIYRWTNGTFWDQVGAELPNISNIISLNGEFLCTQSNEDIDIYRISDNTVELIQTIEVANPIAHHRDHTLIVADRKSNSVDVYEYKEGKFVQTSTIETSSFVTDVYTNGREVVVLVDDGQIRVYDIRSGQQVGNREDTDNNARIDDTGSRVSVSQGGSIKSFVYF